MNQTEIVDLVREAIMIAIQMSAPVMLIGSKVLPAIPLNETLEAEMLPNGSKVAAELQQLLAF